MHGEAAYSLVDESQLELLYSGRSDEWRGKRHGQEYEYRGDVETGPSSRIARERERDRDLDLDRGCSGSPVSTGIPENEASRKLEGGGGNGGVTGVAGNLNGQTHV